MASVTRGKQLGRRKPCSEDEYLRYSGNHLAEYSDGCLEWLPMPTTSHQRIVRFLCRILELFVMKGNLGEVLMAPLRIRLWPRKFREPDIIFMLAAHADRVHEQYWDGADLAMEVVSPDDPDRDLVTKPTEYARARIPEYWIVDPRFQRITVLRLDGDTCAVHCEVTGQGRVESVLLPGFSVAVAEVFAAAKTK